MKLYYNDRRRTFPFLEAVSIRDETGKARYTVKSCGAVGYRLRISDKNGEEAAFVSQKLATIAPKFLVKVNGEEKTVSLKRRLNGDSYCEIVENGWTTVGSVEKREYVIADGEKAVARVRRADSGEKRSAPAYQRLGSFFNASEESFVKGDRCEIEFSDERLEAEILAIVVAIEAALNAR